MNVLKIRSLRTKLMPLFFAFTASFVITLLVYISGGTNTVYTNLMYFPIAVVASAYGYKWGMIHAGISGLLVGPFMPLNVSDSIMQPPLNWSVRFVTYVAIAVIVGLFAELAHKREEKFAYMIAHDYLTGLKNYEALRREPAHSEDAMTLISLDVLDYEEYLGFFGYDFFQQIIFSFSTELTNALRIFPDIEIYRYYGLRYAIKILHEERESDTEKILSALSNINDNTLTVNDVPVYISFRMGLSLSAPNEDPMEGMRKSMIALRLAEKDGQKLVRFNDKMEASYKSTVFVANSFSQALKNEDIRAAYQTIHDSETLEPIGAELLARWLPKNDSPIFPDIFIPVLEKTELIHDLTNFMLDQAIDILQDTRFDFEFVSVNFSAYDFNEKGVLNLVKKIRRKNVSPNRIHIEITERVLLSVTNINAHLTFLSKHGFHIVIDDFGTGYSSYRYVADLPIDVIKIDRSLILKANTARGFSLVKSIVDFCNQFEIDTVAEGVENKEYADICESLGITLQQGYFFSKPEIYSKLPSKMTEQQ